MSFTDSNLSSFGDSVISAFGSGALDNTEAFSALAGFETQSEVEDEVRRLIPDLSNGSEEQVFRVLNNIGNVIDNRLVRLNRSASLSAPVKLAATSLSAIGGADAYATAETGAWIQGGLQNAFQDRRTNGNASFSGYDAENYSIAIGYDHALSSDTIIGLSGSYSTIEIDADRDANDQTDIDVLQVTAYGAHRVGAFEISGQLGYATGDVESQRQAFELIQAEYDIDGFTAQALASYKLGFADSYYAQPLVGIQYGSVDTDAFTENGGLDISFGDRTSDYVEGRIGLRLGTEIENFDSHSDYFISAALVNDFSGDQDDLTIGFANQALSLSTLQTEDTRVDTQAGFDWISSDALSIGVTVDGKFSDTYTALGGSARLKYRF